MAQVTIKQEPEVASTITKVLDLVKRNKNSVASTEEINKGKQDLHTLHPPGWFHPRPIFL